MKTHPSPQRLKDRTGPDRASILIVSLGLLTALVIMGVTFTTLQRIESRSAQNFLERVEAGHVAFAGLQYAIGRLRDAPAWVQGGVWRLGSAHCQYSPDTVNFREFYEYSLVFPTADPAFSGRCDVKVVDCTSQIYVGSTAGAMDNLQAVLEALMSYINTYHSPTSPFSIPSDAASLVAGMATYYHSRSEILSKNPAWGGPAERRDKFRAIRDYLTVHGAADASAIRSDLTSAPRLPINLNTVSGPVLASWLFPMLSRADQIAGAPAPQTAAEALAGALIGQRPFRGWKSPPGAAWTGVADVLNSPVLEAAMMPHYSAGAAAWQADRDEVLANFLPHSLLSHGQPPGGLSKGKDRLVIQTTEGCLNSTGFFQVLLTARITGPPGGGTLFAERRFDALVQTHEIWRQSTQEDFQSGTITRPAELCTYPESLAAGGRSPSRTDGYAGLFPASVTALGGPDFSVSFANSFDADEAETGMNDAATESSAEVDDAAALSDPSGPGFPGELGVAGALLGRDGPDGLWDTADDISEAVYYRTGRGNGKGKGKGNATNFSSTEGTVAFWLQLSFTPTASSPARQLFYLPFESITLLGSPPVSYSRYLEFYIEGTNLKARYYGWDIVNLTLYTLEGSKSIAAWKKGEWHYVGLTWDADDGAGGSVLTLYADGQSSVATGLALDPGNTLDAAGLQDRARFGAKGSGANAREVGTMDEIRAWESLQPAAAADPGADRYVATSMPLPELVSAAYPSSGRRLPYGVRIATAAWTEYLPDDGGTADIRLIVEVDNTGSGTFDTPVSSDALSDGVGGPLSSGGGPLETGYRPGGTGVHIRTRVSFRSAAAADGINHGGAAGSYPAGCGSPTRRAVDTPILDDITLTLLPPPRVLAWREVPED